MNLTIKLKLFLAFFAIMFFIFIFCDGFIIEALFSTIIGGGFVYTGFYMRKYIQNMKKYGIRTQAKIIDFHVKEVRKTRMGSDDITEKVQYYYPIVSFVDLNGIQVTQKADSSVNFKEINDLIDIIYLKKKR